MPNASAEFSIYVEVDKSTKATDIVDSILKDTPEVDKAAVIESAERLHNYFKECRELDMRDMSSYVKVDTDYDAFIEALGSYLGLDVYLEIALRICEETGKIHINRAASDEAHITTIKVND